MRRILAPLLALALVGVIVPAASAAQACPKLVGAATIVADGAGHAAGTAVVKLGGATEVVSFTSTLATGIQVWEFAAHDVTFEEHASSSPVGTHYLSIDSTVDVLAPDSGSLTYHGLFDTDTLTGYFVLNGRLCIS